MRYRIPILALLWTLSSAAVNQTNALPKEPLRHYERGVELYRDHKYAAAQAEFGKAEALLGTDDEGYGMRTRYYIAVCSARTRQDNAEELLKRFVAEYPHSIYANDIRFALGSLLQDRGEYAEAYRELMAVNPRELEYARSDEYNFRTGYCAYMNGDTETAYNYFRQCASDPTYRPHATYYTAYIDYTRGNLAQAKTGFLSIADNEAYGPLIPFYLLQIEFMEGNYPYVVANGTVLAERATDARRKEIARILSESHFHLEEYDNALSRIEEYESLGGEMGREELYLAGFCNYHEGMYENAAEQLAQLTSGNDDLSQNACFHLGGCYLKMNDKPQALKAFSLAAGNDSDPGIREEALFNCGKLQYELGGSVFNDAITTLSAYVQNYPDSPRTEEAREILLAAYFNSRNYDAAYEAIKQVRNPDNNVKTAFQKIAYYRALECFDNGDYDTALRMLDEADANRFNPKYTALTKFWRAETLVKKGEPSKAVPLYKEYIRLSPRSEYENKMAGYSLGYCYFNDRKWDEASQWFNRFASSYDRHDLLLADTYNRLGDIAFAGRKYNDAIGYYDKSVRLGTSATEYARFQRAVMLGLADRTDAKIDALLGIISAGEGDYVDDAMFELGRTYVRKDRFNEGASVFKNLIARYPDSPYHLSALTELGLTYQNLGRDEEALKYYKEIVGNYPDSPQAKDALLGIRNIYVDRNEVDSYFSFARESGIETDVSVVAKDSLTFAAANRVYLEGDHARALSLMDNYLRQYPRGGYRVDALFAIGDCSLQQGNKAAALTAFEEIGAMPSNRYKVSALQQAAKIQSEEQDYAAAAATYRTLSTTATQSTVISAALEGYLNAVMAAGDVAAMGEAADFVLASTFAGSDLVKEAHFAKAKALEQQNDPAAALEHYGKAKESRSREGAESRYRIASILYQQDKLKEAEAEIQAFAEQNTQYQYWLGKAFLLLGDIYVRNNDAFQAKATYQSIIDGYADKTDGIVAEARAKIDALE